VHYRVVSFHAPCCAPLLPLFVTRQCLTLKAAAPSAAAALSGPYTPLLPSSMPRPTPPRRRCRGGSQRRCARPQGAPSGTRHVDVVGDGESAGVRRSLVRMVQRILQCQREQERPKRVVLAHAWLRRHGQCPLKSPNDVQPPRCAVQCPLDQRHELHHRSKHRLVTVLSECCRSRSTTLAALGQPAKELRPALFLCPVLPWLRRTSCQ
jgi:hypothetical protein